MVTYGVFVNTAGWEKHDHQETGMDGALFMPQLSGIHKDQQRERMGSMEERNHAKLMALVI